MLASALLTPYWEVMFQITSVLHQDPKNKQEWESQETPKGRKA